MNRLAAFLLATLLALPAGAQGQPAAAPQAQRGTAEQYLDSIGALTAQKCGADRGAAAAQAEKEGKHDVAAALRRASIMLCDCMPAQTASLRAHLPPGAKTELLDEGQFQSRYIAQLMGPCAAQSLKASYTEDCPVQFAGKRPNTPAYCACMAQSVGGLSNDDLIAAGLESSDYAPRAADAQQRKLPPPEPPPHVKQLMAMDKQCTAK